MKVQAFKSSFIRFRITILSFIVLCVTNIGFIVDGARNDWFQSLCDFMQYDRILILKGELWRLLTCHLVHWGPQHFYLDVSVFLVLGIAFESKIGHRYGQMLFVSGVVISSALLLFQNDLATYRGISGLINSQIILGTGLCLFDSDMKKLATAFYASVFSVHLLKTVYETIFQVSFFSTETLGRLGLFTPLAHFTGVLVAFCYLLASISPRAKTYYNLMPKLPKLAKGILKDYGKSFFNRCLF